MQLIAYENTIDGGKIIINCPRCEAVVRVDPLSFCVANRPEFALECSDCNKEFWFEITCLTRSAEQRNDAETGIPAALRPPTDEELNALTELKKVRRWA